MSLGNDTTGCSIIRVQRNPKGQAFKEFFEYRKSNYADSRFIRKWMPAVNEKYVRAMKRKTRDTTWVSSSPEIAAAEDILLDLCNNGLLEVEEGEPNIFGDKKIYYSLTEKGKNTSVEFG
jgi:DNA-binding PadR family transcriptional regulator